MDDDTLRCLACEALLTNMTERVCAECAPQWYRKTIKDWRQTQ